MGLSVITALVEFFWVSRSALANQNVIVNCTKTPQRSYPATKTKSVQACIACSNPPHNAPPQTDKVSHLRSEAMSSFGRRGRKVQLHLISCILILSPNPEDTYYPHIILILSSYYPHIILRLSSYYPHIMN